ncbi:hypothetical protein NKH56_28185 [Mesorhizobium sp. M1076]|uniref:hypothetical protein n=1 Tax=Mesorhizobium sp. M1076 TaxID=2957054 RepID=UPI00333CEFBF
MLSRLDRWIRRRLRSIAWKQWKHGRTRFAELRRRGVGHDLAAQTAGSAHGPWRISNSPALAIALRTHSSLASALLALPPPRPHNQPNRPVRTRMQGGVGGEEPRGSPLSRLARIRSEKFGLAKFWNRSLSKQSEVLGALPRQWKPLARTCGSHRVRAIGEEDTERFRDYPSLGRGNFRRTAFNVACYYVESAKGRDYRCISRNIRVRNRAA